MQQSINASQQQVLSPLNQPSSSAEVRAMFDAIAPRYDLLNWLLSGGMHKVWESRLVSSLPDTKECVCLDLCTGTGALVPALAARYLKVVGVDISSEMLARARERHGNLSNVDWREGDAQSLEFADNVFDVITVAYGVRNWPDRELGLREIARVLRVGGTVGILEFGQPRGYVWSRVFKFYSSHVIPRVGGLISGSRAAYEYLPKTSAAFPCGDSFNQLLIQSGLVATHCIPLMGGIAFIYIAKKTPAAMSTTVEE